MLGRGGPLSLDSGLAQVRDDAQKLLDGEVVAHAVARGSITHRDLLAEYADYVTSLVDLTGIRLLRVVVDAGNGMAGCTVARGFERCRPPGRRALL